MPLGAGMADIVIGKALRNDLVRQIAVRARNRNHTEDFLRTAAITGNHRHSRGFKSIALTRRLETSARLHGAVVGGRSIRSAK